MSLCVCQKSFKCMVLKKKLLKCCPVLIKQKIVGALVFLLFSPSNICWVHITSMISSIFMIRQILQMARQHQSDDSIQILGFILDFEMSNLHQTCLQIIKVPQYHFINKTNKIFSLPKRQTQVLQRQEFSSHQPTEIPGKLSQRV